MKKLLLFIFLLGFAGFTANGQVTSVGVIGTATPDDWNSDVDMVQDAIDTAKWSLDIDLTVGDIKFRANDDWAINWGATDFPSGTAVLGSSDNIQVPTAGNYTILFNSNTGEYSFTENPSNSFSVGVIGTATPDDWNSDVDMVQDAADTAKWSLDIDLKVGDIKFRANDDWVINWGATDFPSGTAVLGSSDNIQVPTAGNYTILFNSNTGEYSFTENPSNSFSVGVIGTATPDDWNSDVDMVQDANDTAKWSLDIDLKVGDIKFRANDDWAINWGATDFPSGTAVLGSSDNIPVPTAGNYTILFNSNTGEYSFTIIPDVVYYNSVGVIGTSTPGGWSDDTDMVRDTEDSAKWSLDITLTAGEIKFRADDSWDNNWGATDFPTGTAELGNSSNIPAYAGDYTIYFNSATGEYSFQVHSDVGIIGDATPGKWDEDTDMFKDTTEHGYFIVMDLEKASCKFRAFNSWDTNWGATDFPEGVAVLGSSDNIPVSKAGKYLVKFDTLSGAYSFTEKVEFGSIGIIGDATPGGWDEDTDMVQDGDNPDLWSIDIELKDGGAKFRVDNAWTINWGGIEFPSGTGVLSSPDNIPVTAGNYKVTFNTTTLEYNFFELVDYEFVSLTGDATGGWGVDFDLTKDVNDGSIWVGSYKLADGEAKFRANHAWDVYDWGSGDFPQGTGVIGGANIPVVAGEYKITLNSITGAYNFEVFVVYDSISLVGNAGPFGAWPSDDDKGANDTYLTIDPDNNQLWTATEVTLTDADTVNDGGIKFRANTDWTVNWGERAFPAGVGTQSGPNIWCTAGTYDVSLNTNTGEYAFTPSNSTEEVLDPATINVYPNPVSEKLNIDISNVNFGNQVVVNIYDMNGKLVYKSFCNAKDIIEINTSNFKTGNYLMNITGNGILVGKKFSVLK